MAPTATLQRTGEPILSVRNLRTRVSSQGIDFEVVRGFSLDVYRDEVVCLVGESGCGKTMAALSMMRLIPSPPARISGGEVVFDGQDLVSLSSAEMRKIRTAQISMIFQDPLTSLDPSFTVGSMLTEVIRAHRSVSRGDAMELAASALEEVEIPAARSQLDAYPHQLSGGMRQRVMIAMALMLEPELLIADEPTTALDVTVQAQILERLLEEQQERHMAMLLITHDLAVVAQIADRVAVMYSGEIVEMASVDELFANPRHPYTQGLLQALPATRSGREPLYSIPGRVPPPQFTPPGCYFAPRCPHALDRCWEERPALESADGELLRCFNPQPYVKT